MECTGIVETCWAHKGVIEETVRLGANLIICHKALFWNHGDHTAWLKEQENLTYLHKVALHEEHGIVVWRDHDYIHSGIPLDNGKYADGIFYGLADILGWIPYIDEEMSEEIDQAEGWSGFSVQGKMNPLSYAIPEMTVGELARFLVDRLELNGVKVMGIWTKKFLVSQFRSMSLERRNMRSLWRTRGK